MRLHHDPLGIGEPRWLLQDFVWNAYFAYVVQASCQPEAPQFVSGKADVPTQLQGEPGHAVTVIVRDGVTLVEGNTEGCN
jgi:hypothetical protein